MRSWLFYCAIILIIGFAAQAAPDPVIYLPFDGDLDNYGTAVPDTGYFTTEGGLTPGFGPGILGGALDFRMAPEPNWWWDDVNDTYASDIEPMGKAIWGVYDEKAHDFGDPNTWPDPCDANSIDPTLLLYGEANAVDTPMELALDDACSLTIMMWIKPTGPNGLRTSTTFFCRPRPYNIITQDDGSTYYPDIGYPTAHALRLTNLHEHGSIRLYADGDKSENIFPNIEQSCNNNWRFLAVTYDGTEGFFPITWYTGWGDEPSLSTGQTARLNNVWIDPAGPISLGKHEPIVIGNLYPDGWGGNYPFKGMIDEVRIFVSKTDASGALSRTEILPYYMEVFENEACGDPNHPNPVGDLNYDCIVDERDLDVLGLYWLKNNSQ